MDKKEKFIYLAGMTDGDGCVKPRIRNENGKKRILGRYMITNTSKDLIDWLVKNFGGKVYTTKREGNRKVQYRWELRNQEIRDILPKVVPYLIVKKKEGIESLKLVNMAREKRLIGGKHSRKCVKCSKEFTSYILDNQLFCSLPCFWRYLRINKINSRCEQFKELFAKMVA